MLALSYFDTKMNLENGCWSMVSLVFMEEGILLVVDMTFSFSEQLDLQNEALNLVV